MIALIDGDILAYRFSYAFQEDYDWQDCTSTVLDLDGAKRELDIFVKDLLEKTNTSNAVIALSDWRNFRLKLTKTYKENRADIERPKLLDDLKVYMREEYDAMSADWLEADDYIGIWVTAWPDTYICCSLDKDLDQIPGQHYNWNHDKLYTVTEEEADAFFYQQALSGDPTDGFGGCPGYGPTKAKKLVANPTLLVPYEYEFQKGKRKGQTETRYEEVETDSVWAAIINRYNTKGLSEKDALLTARLARILRAGEYDWATNEVKLWTP